MTGEAPPDRGGAAPPSGGGASEEGGVPWRRMLWEGLTVVFSILLAFAINAWWQGRQTRDRERELLAGLLSDFRSTRSDLSARLQMARRMMRNASALRDDLAATPPGRSLSVPDSLVIAAIGSPTYQPATNTLDAALSSGELELIRNEEIRQEISSWRLILDDTFESERDVRAVTNQQIVPALARDVTLGPLFDRAVDWSYGRDEPTGRAILHSSRELEGALATRVFYQSFAVSGFETLRASLERMVTLLQAELGEGRSGGSAEGGGNHGDSSYAELQQRGGSPAGMGVDQYTSAHRFDDLPDGGRIELVREVEDSVGVERIRAHLRHIARAFASGDFRIPAFVHDTGEVPGTTVMARKRDAIRYEVQELPRGAELRMSTEDPEAVAAIHRFLAFQRREHHAPGREAH